MAEPTGSGRGALPPRFSPKCDCCGKRFPAGGPRSRWAYEEGKILVEREFCAETKEECRARYERGESLGSGEQAQTAAPASPALEGQERETWEPPQQLTLFG